MKSYSSAGPRSLEAVRGPACEGVLRNRMTTDQGQRAAKASERGAATRAALLAAAREVFTTEGYAQAGVTDIVNEAGASVGSLYHHFSGKADLFLTLV